MFTNENKNKNPVSLATVVLLLYPFHRSHPPYMSIIFLQGADNNTSSALRIPSISTYHAFWLYLALYDDDQDQTASQWDLRMWSYWCFSPHFPGPFRFAVSPTEVWCTVAKSDQNPSDYIWSFSAFHDCFKKSWLMLLINCLYSCFQSFWYTYEGRKGLVSL